MTRIWQLKSWRKLTAPLLPTRLVKYSLRWLVWSGVMTCMIWSGMTHAVPCGSYGTGLSTCTCNTIGTVVRYGSWIAGTNSPGGDISDNVNRCASATDTVCSLPAVGAASDAPSFTSGDTLYFQNTTETPPEHFKCNFIAGPSNGYTTSAHNPSPAPVGASATTFLQTLMLFIFMLLTPSVLLWLRRKPWLH